MSWPLTLQDIKTLLEIVAIAGAGIWAYLKFVRGRLFRHKLDLNVEGEFLTIDGSAHVLVRITIRNIGFTSVSFDTECCVLRVFAAEQRPYLDFTDAALWHRVATVPLLEDHNWIEPSEVLQEQELIHIHSEPTVAIRLVANVSDSRSLWGASAIAVRSGSPAERKEE